MNTSVLKRKQTNPQVRTPRSELRSGVGEWMAGLESPHAVSSRRELPPEVVSNRTQSIVLTVAFVIAAAIYAASLFGLLP